MVEVISTFDFNQLQPNESPDQCGFAATALCFAAGPPGGAPRQPVQWAIEKMAAWYTEYNGADVPSNHQGMELWQLYKLIVEKGGHYQAIDANAASIASWIEARYPVIIAVVESSVYDVHLKARPYSWDTAGLNHIFVVTGIDSGHIFLCRDTVNQHSGSPYSYDGDKLQYISATVFVPDWMPRPTSSIAPHEEENVTIDIHNPEIAKHFKELNTHQWECTDEGPCKGRVIQYAMLSNYKQEGNKGLCGLDILGRPISNEHSLAANDVIQFYENGVRRWKDNQVKPVPLYDPNSPGRDPELLAKIKELEAQLAAAQPQPHYLDVINKIKADLQGL